LAIEEIQNIFSMTNDGSTGGVMDTNVIHMPPQDEMSSSDEQLDQTNLSSVVVEAG